METWGLRLPFYYRELNKGIKRIYSKTSWQDKPHEYIPPSFFTRQRDNVNCPRDPELFKAAYHPLTFSELPAATRSFHLEYLHRSLFSRNKQYLMLKTNTSPNCPHCNEIASSAHVLNDCFIAQMIKKSFKAFFQHKGWKNNLLSDDTFLEFFWWEPKIWAHRQYKELWAVWAETRRHAHACDSLPRFERFGPHHFMAKLQTAFRKAAEVAHINRFKLATELCDFVVDIDIRQFQTWYLDIEKQMKRPTFRV